VETSHSGPRAPDDPDASETSALPIALGCLILAILAFVATHAQAKIVDVVEFYSATKDHYFITSIKEEIDKYQAALQAAAQTLGATSGQ
jgi:hypothetical protein